MNKYILIATMLLLFGCTDKKEDNNDTDSKVQIQQEKVTDPTALLDYYNTLGTYLYETIKFEELEYITEARMTEINEGYKTLQQNMLDHPALEGLYEPLKELYTLITFESAGLGYQMRNDTGQTYVGLWEDVTTLYQQNKYFVIEDYFVQVGADRNYKELQAYRETISYEVETKVLQRLDTIIKQQDNPQLIMDSNLELLEYIRGVVKFPSRVKWVNDLYTNLGAEGVSPDVIVTKSALIQGDIIAHASTVYPAKDKELLMQIESY